jgi:sulfur-carrier protein
MVTVLLSAGWAHRGQKQFQCREGTVRDVLREFAETYPGYRRRLLDETGEPLTYYNVYLDGDLVGNADRAQVIAKADSTVAIVPPLAGG